MKKFAPILVGCLLAVGLAAPADACGTSAVCGDVATSITGEIQSDIVRIEWTTNDENSSVWHYVVRSYSCSDPGACSPGTIVDVVTPVSSCGVSHGYQVDDDSETLGVVYSVEVWSGPLARVCAIDVEPQ